MSDVQSFNTQLHLKGYMGKAGAVPVKLRNPSQLKLRAKLQSKYIGFEITTGLKI
jgi:hypothetical protein